MNSFRTRLWSPLGLLVAGLACVAILVINLASASATTETTVAVQANKQWTDSGIALTAGEKVTIAAEGKISYGSNSTDKTGPPGAKFTVKNCGKDSYPSNSAMTAPGVNCWSLLFRVGNTGIAFPTGSKITFISPVAGELELGINDNVFFDNSGSFTAKITTP